MAPREPLARIVVLAGPSGSGKTRLAQRLGLPVVPLDEFYRDAGDPAMPAGTDGHLDWESPQSWHLDEALDALRELCSSGTASIPRYSYALNRRVGEQTISLGASRYAVTEGIFADEVIAPLQREGLLAEAVLIVNHRVTTFSRRLRRDLGDRRKPVRDILRIGALKLRAEAQMVGRLEAAGCTPMSAKHAEMLLRTMIKDESPSG